MAYTKHGPFVNGSAPGIDQNFLNAVETELVSLNTAATDANISSDGKGLLFCGSLAVDTDASPDSTSTVFVQGTVSGQCQITQYITGNVGRILIYFVNYKSASAQTLKLPQAFIHGAVFHTSEMQGGKIEALASGTAQTFSIQTGTAVGGGTQAPQTFIASWSYGLCRSGFDTIRVTVTGSTATSGFCTFEGV